MATITYEDGSIHTIGTAGLSTPIAGHNASRPVFANAERAQKIVQGKIVGDSSYPTGGEDISNIWDNFAGGLLKGMFVGQPVSTADTGKLAAIDFTNKKLLLYTALGTELGNTVTWANTTIYFIAWGPR